MIALIGLLLIASGWFYQLIHLSKKQIQPVFVGLYGLGVGVLIIDGFLGGAKMMAWANGLTLVPAIMIFLKIKHI